MLDDDVIAFDDEAEAPLQAGVPADVELRQVDDEHQPVDGEAHPADSPLHRLKAAYSKRLEKKRLVMELPAWEGELLAEFKPLSPRDAKQLRSTTRGDRNDLTKVVAELLCAASLGLSHYDPDGNAVPLVVDGQRLTFADVGAFTGLAVKTPRQGFLALFQEGPAREINETSLQAFAESVSRWMADTSLQVDGAVDVTVNEAGDTIAETVDSGS